jgi:Lipocalin-like domain
MALPSSPAAVADLEKQLFGVWKIESLYTETKADEWQESYGARPNGYGVLTRERRLMVIITAPDRKAPIMDADRSTAFLSMIAYRDPYRVEDGRFITREWIPPGMRRGSARNRCGSSSWEGDTMTLTSAWQPDPNAPGNPEVRYVSGAE